MKFFVEYNLDEKIPASVQEVFSKVKEISNISLISGIIATNISLPGFTSG